MFRAFLVCGITTPDKLASSWNGGGVGAWVGVLAGLQLLVRNEEEKFLATGIVGQQSPFLLQFASSCLSLAAS